jgi:predicted O-methyltransferase YrrM
MTSTEDRWTPSSPWCPNPEWWHSDPEDPDPAEEEVTALVMALVYATQPEVVVETGTATGDTALAIGRALDGNGHGHLWTVEIDEAAAKIAAETVEGLPVTVVCADSTTWEPPPMIDLAWIDSGTAAQRAGEISRWRDRFRAGALVCVHDTAPNMGREALRGQLGGLNGQLRWQRIDLRTPRGVTILQVT